MKKILILVLLCFLGAGCSPTGEQPLGAGIETAKENVLHSVEKNGIVKYVYKNGNLDNIPALSDNIKREIKRTPNARIFERNDGKKVAEIVGGKPRYWQDENGEWWKLEYATSTKETFDLAMKPTALETIAGFFGNPAEAAISTTTPDADPESTTVDGTVYRDDSTWSATRNTATGDGASDSGTKASPLSNENTGTYRIDRAFFLFDISSIPSNISVSQTEFKFACGSNTNTDNDGDDFIRISSSTPASDTGLATGDYDAVGTTAFAPDIDIGDLNDGSSSLDNKFTFNSTGNTYIEDQASDDQIVELGIREGHDVIDDSICEGCYNEANIYSADQGGNVVPSLVITYTEVTGAVKKPKVPDLPHLWIW